MAVTFAGRPRTVLTSWREALDRAASARDWDAAGAAAGDAAGAARAAAWAEAVGSDGGPLAVIGYTHGGDPRHPLYVRRDATFQQILAGGIA